MLKIFLSSTFVDLEDERAILITKISPLLDAVHMERFIPDGRRSQAVALDYLKKSDIVIFLISPYYGSLIGPNACLVEDCKADGCPKGDISYTHCEYRFTVAEKKPHMVYMVSPEAETTDSYVAKKCADNKALYDSFKQEIYNNEMASSIGAIDIDQYGRITSDLADNIVRWYGEGKIEIAGFFGRGNELKKLMELVDNGNERVLVHGVGGVGKTTLIQVMLLLQALKGKRVYAIGTPQSFLSGSGYSHFLASNIIHKETQRPETISLIDLANLFDIPNERRTEEGELKKDLLEYLKQGDVLTFIDDFHLADNDVISLVQQTKRGIILASKEESPYGRCQLRLKGVKETSRLEAILGIARRLGVPEDRKAFQLIGNISEGHPVVIELLLRNYQFVDYEDIIEALSAERLTEQDFLTRAVLTILSKEGFVTLQHLAILNPVLTTNLDFDVIRKTFSTQSINELIRKGLLAKRDNSPDKYQITFQSIQQIISNGCQDNQECHIMAQLYYANKIEKYAMQDPCDSVEMMYHIVMQLKCGTRHKDSPNLNDNGQGMSLKNHVIEGIKIVKDVLRPHDHCYGRLAVVGEELIPLLNLEEKGRVLSSLGEIYHHLLQYNKAEMAYHEVIAISQKISDRPFGKNSAELAWTCNCLGVIYAETHREEKAKEFFLRSFELYTELAKSSPDEYLPYVAGAQSNLGMAYDSLHQYEEAENALKTSRDIYMDISRNRPGVFEDDLARIHTALGILFLNTKRYSEAEEEHKAALKCRLKLATISPIRNDADLAAAYTNLGILCIKLEQYDEAEKNLIKGLEIYKQLVKIDYDLYGAGLANILVNLGNLYKSRLIFDKAETYYKDAIEIIEKKVQQTPGVFEGLLAGLYCNLGNLYMYSPSKEKAEAFLLAAIDEFHKLAEQNPHTYGTKLAGAHLRLGDVYRNCQRLEDAEVEYRKSFDIRLNLAEQNPRAYFLALSRCATNLIVVLKMRGKQKEADEIIRIMTRIQNLFNKGE